MASTHNAQMGQDGFLQIWGPPGAVPIAVFIIALDLVMTPLATSNIVEELDASTEGVQAAIALVSLVAAPLYLMGG